MSKNALETMQDLLQERLGIDKNKVTLDSSLEDLGIDSLMQIELLFDFEDNHSLPFSGRGRNWVYADGHVSNEVTTAPGS